MKRWKKLTLVGFGVLTLTYLGVLQLKATPSPVPIPVKPAPAHVLGVSDINVFDLYNGVNTYRVSKGVAPLSLSPKLTASAVAKCNDMVEKVYFSHYSPDGSAPWVFMDSAGAMGSPRGENLANAFSSSRDTLESWIKSPTHERNLVDDNFTDVGYGVCLGKNSIAPTPALIVVQHLAKL